LLANGVAVALPVLALVPHLTAHLAVWPDRTHGDLARCHGGGRFRPIARWMLPAQLSAVLALLTIGATLGLNAAATGATFAHRLAITQPDAPALASIADRPADAWSLVGLTALLALSAGWLLRRRRSTEVASSGRAPHQ
jgi:LPXTG-motif cell wall-anchored protein